MLQKYCVIPGCHPVRLASTDGNVIIIGETPRPIPDSFILQAKAAGCLSEVELEAITKRLVKASIVSDAPVKRKDEVVPVPVEPTPVEPIPEDPEADYQVKRPGRSAKP